MIALVGCVHSKAVECDDGRLCPPESVCVPNGCARTDGCGDGRMDPGEECDDNNLAAGDGCSAICTIEICGNGVMDPTEECDDGNATSHDGCSSGCLVEQPVWRDGGAGPSGRRGHVAVWDPDHGTGVLHGGTSTISEKDTWLWNGVWTKVADGPQRTFHAIASDRAGRILIFGGTDGGGIRQSGTFAWDGSGWSPVVIPGAPPDARFDHVMSPDVVAGQVVVYGGVASTGVTVDTWVLEPTGWKMRLLAGVANQQDLRFTYDPIAALVIVVGGSPTTHDTWRWNGMTYTRHGDGLQRVDHVQDWDSARRRIVVFGGADPSNSNETDEFDGETWTKLATGGPLPPKRTRGAGFYDPIRHELVIMGGQQNTTYLGDTWILQWTSTTPDDACDGTTDLDGDRLKGCDDPDCWARCTPRCPPGTTCDPSAPHCGDGVCNPALETPTLCPSDC